MTHPNYTAGYRDGQKHRSLPGLQQRIRLNSLSTQSAYTAGYRKALEEQNIAIPAK